MSVCMRMNPLSIGVPDGAEIIRVGGRLIQTNSARQRSQIQGTTTPLHPHDPTGVGAVSCCALAYPDPEGTRSPDPGRPYADASRAR